MSWKEKYLAFKSWQQSPYEVAPLSEEAHDCPTCGTHYQGNFCPRCGQSAKVGRYSFKKALLLFIDVWGLGNRGMFRTLRDLLLRPGYMIRDYLNGMQMAYFPPFKMLFLLTTLSVLVAHGLNITGTSQAERQRQDIISVQMGPASLDEERNTDGVDFASEEWINRIYDIQERFPNVLSLAFIVLISSFYFIFFRKTQAFDRLRYSEFFIAMVYTANMLSIYEVILTFFCLPAHWVAMASVLTIIPLKQFSGFTWKRTILSMLGAFAIMLTLVFVVTLVGVILGMAFFPELLPAPPAGN